MNYSVLAAAAVSLPALFNGFLKTTGERQSEEEQHCGRTGSRGCFISRNDNRRKKTSEITAAVILYIL